MDSHGISAKDFPPRVCEYGSHDCDKNNMGRCIHHQRDDLEKKYRELQDLEWHKDHHQRHRLENVRDDVVQAIACIEDKEYRSALDILHSVASMLYSE